MTRHGEGSWGTVTRGERTYFRYRITIDGRTIERVSADRKKLEKEAQKLRTRARAHLIGDDEETTFGAWAVDRWLPMKELELGRPGEKTIRNYRSALERHVLPVLGRVKLRDLRAQHRRRLQAAMVAKGLKASTINVVDGIVKAVLQAAATEELPVVVSAIDAVRSVKGAPETAHRLALADVRAILAAAHGSDWLPLWVCFAATGARDSEVRALRWEDWDADAGVLLIRRQIPQQPGDPPQWLPWIKGRKIERRVPVVPLLAQALRGHRARQNAARLQAGRLWSDYGLIFPDEVGRALPAMRVNRQFRAAVAAAGVEPWKGLGVHALRHTANDTLRDAGVDGPTRALVLGHSTAVNEKYYVGDNDRLAVAAMDKLAGAFGS